MKKTYFNAYLVGSNIAFYRKKRGFTQDKLAFLLNTNRATISKWERAVNVPSTEMIFYISKVLNISVDILIGI